MVTIACNKPLLDNIESPFTELFSVLKRYQIQPHGDTTLAYETHELTVIHHHVDNAMGILLQGLQDVGQLLGVTQSGKEKIIVQLNNIGFFISGVGNLVEALYALRADAEHVLNERRM